MPCGLIRRASILRTPSIFTRSFFSRHPPRYRIALTLCRFLSSNRERRFHGGAPSRLMPDRHLSVPRFDPAARYPPLSSAPREYIDCFRDGNYRNMSSDAIGCQGRGRSVHSFCTRVYFMRVSLCHGRTMRTMHGEVSIARRLQKGRNVTSLGCNGCITFNPKCRLARASLSARLFVTS